MLLAGCLVPGFEGGNERFRDATDVRLRSSDWPQGRRIDGSDCRGRGGDHCLQAAHAFAAGRLPPRASAGDSASNALVIASLLQRHGNRGCPRLKEASEAEVKPYPIGDFHLDSAEARTAAASSLSSSPSTGRLSSPLSNAARRSRGATPQTSCVNSLVDRLRPSLTKVLSGFTRTEPTSPIPLATPGRRVEIRETITNQKPFRAQAFE